MSNKKQLVTPSEFTKIQDRIGLISKKSGFDKETIEQKFMLLFEEVGELAKSVRSLVGTKIGKHSKIHDTEEEASDVFYVLLDICNKLGVDLKQSFDKKIKKVERRYIQLKV